MCAHTYALQLNSVTNTETTWTIGNWLRQNKTSNNQDSKNRDCTIHKLPVLCFNKILYGDFK